MFTGIYSKTFSQKLRDNFNAAEIADIEKAVNRVLVDPHLHDYKRPYLDHYRQEHPTNKQITIFFEIIDAQTVLFVWVNDESCLHTTRTPKEDPCIKEFNRLKDLKAHEVFNKKYHEGDFFVKPRVDFPVYMSFKKYDATLFSTVLNDGVTFYSMNINCREDDTEIFDHYSLYFKHIYKHFKAQKQNFEFRIPNCEIDLIQKINTAASSVEWQMLINSDLIIWKMI